MHVVASLLLGTGIFVSVIGSPFVLVYLLALANHDRVMMEVMRLGVFVYIFSIFLGVCGAVMLSILG